jgi:hypothetical protein
MPAYRVPLYLGIQRGAAVVDDVAADTGRATFIAEFRVGKQADGSPNFLGPYAQGSAADRFFYLSWGVKPLPGVFEMIRRLKIRLGHLKWRTITSAIKSGEPLVVRLQMTDAKGGPLCATPPASHITWEPLASLG